jgi:CBS domain-containing protein
MAAIFAGASRALLASVVFAFETTLQPLGLLPLLGGCSASFLVSCLLMPNTIMTEKIARRGVRVPAEYAADFLEQVLVRDAYSHPVTTLQADQTLADAQHWMTSRLPGTTHQGFPVLDRAQCLIGVLTRRDVFDPMQQAHLPLNNLIKRPPILVYDDCTLREAADQMVHHDIGRLPVVSREEPEHVIGIITRSDVLRAHRQRLEERHHLQQSIRLRVDSSRTAVGTDRFSKQNLGD